MANKLKTTDKEREKHIKIYMEEMKQSYDTVSEKLWNLESRTSRKFKLDVLLRNSIAQDKLVVEKPSGTRVDFVEPQQKKRESTPLPWIDSTMASGEKRTATKGEA